MLRKLTLFSLIFHSYIYLSTTTNKPKVIKTPRTILTKCYSTYNTNLDKKYFNYSIPVDCSGYCFSFMSKQDGLITESASCGNATSFYKYGFFIVKLNYTAKLGSCSTNLCNTRKFAQKELNYKCEFNKKLKKNAKLILPNRKINEPSVKQCYYCKRCISAESASIVNCYIRNNTINNFACLVSDLNSTLF